MRERTNGKKLVICIFSNKISGLLSVESNRYRDGAAVAPMYTFSSLRSTIEVLP